MEDTPTGGCHKLPKGEKLPPRCAVCGGPFPDGSGCEYCPAVDPPAETLHSLAPEPLTGNVDSDGYLVDLRDAPEALAGNIDGNGDVVDLLLVRLRAAVGPDVAADVDPDVQVSMTLALLQAGGRR